MNRDVAPPTMYHHVHARRRGYRSVGYRSVESKHGSSVSSLPLHDVRVAVQWHVSMCEALGVGNMDPSREELRAVG